MPLNLKRRDGSVTPFRNSEYLPFYYFIPKNILQKCGAELNAIPRNPQMVFTNYEACEFIESDLFTLLIIDAAAYLVWEYMGFDEYMEVYSGYDPAWKLAHQPDYWIKELTDGGIIQYKFVGCIDVPETSHRKYYEEETRKGVAVKYIPKPIPA